MKIIASIIISLCFSFTDSVPNYGKETTTPPAAGQPVQDPAKQE